MQERNVRVRGGDGPTSDEAFENTRDAADYLSQRLSSHWQVQSFIGKNLLAELVETSPAERDQIALSVDGQDIGTIQRGGGETEGVTYTEGNLVAHIGPYHRSPHFDRGLLWVYAGGNAESSMRFGLRPEHGLDAQGLEEQIDTAFERGDAFVVGLLEGQPDPPHSKNFLETEAA